MSVAVVEVEAASALTPTGGFLRTFTHTLNPYSGCAFGCVYCYVRQGLAAKLEALPWGRYVKPKLGVHDRLEEELRRAEDRGTLGSLRIFMSSVTDPYQPEEKRRGITRRCLESLARRPPQVLVLQTRSPLVLRDRDLLRVLGERLWLSMTVETNDERIRRSLTPACPPISRRLEAMEVLHSEDGLRVQAALSPLLPHEPEAFAGLIAPRCTRAVVDTFVSGDGSRGKRSARNGVPALYASLGLCDWSDESAARSLYAFLRERLGPERVVWSCEGFNAV